MAQRGKFDSGRLLVSWTLTDNPGELVELETGAEFPERIQLVCRYKNGPLLHITAGVSDGRAVVFAMNFEADPLMEAPSGLTA